MTDRPPRLEDLAQSATSPWLPAAVLLGVLLALASARLFPSSFMPLPLCGFRALTGLPCPLCGGTRAVQAAARLDWSAAVRLNPLVSLAGAIVGLCLASWLFDCWLRTDLLKQWRRLARGRWRVPLVATLILLNWIYLCLALP